MSSNNGSSYSKITGYTSSTSNDSYKVKNLTKGKVYFFKYNAVNSAGSSNTSLILKAVSVGSISLTGKTVSHDLTLSSEAQPLVIRWDEVTS